jgi:hypothetical protein
LDCSELIARVRSHGCDVVNANGALRVTGQTANLPVDLLSLVRESKPALSELLTPASTAYPYTVTAPRDQSCVECGHETMVMITLGKERFCRSCLIGELPQLQEKPANCRTCGLRVVKSEAYHTKTNGYWYCSKEGCYKQWGREKRLRDKLNGSTRKTGIGSKGQTSRKRLESGPTTSEPLLSTSTSSSAPSKTEPFDAWKADSALRARGLTLTADHAHAEYKGGWRVAVESRVVREPLGHRVVRPGKTLWSVDPAVYFDSKWHTETPTETPVMSEEYDPLGGGSWKR